MKALRVLVVEDDALIAILLADLLAGMGHDVCATAATEAEAVSAASRYGPDLMIVDAGLARGSGVSAVEEILRAGPLAHVFISGDAERVQRRSRTRWLSANRSGKLNSPELSIWLSPLPLRTSEKLCGSGESATETVVAGDAAVWDVFAYDWRARIVVQHHPAARVIPR